MVAVVALALGAVGCAGPLGEGEAQFRKGRYPEAKQTLAKLEGESRDWADAERAEYALYRGLTFAALGDRGAAAVWLRKATLFEEAHPGALIEDDARRLAVARDANAFPSDGASLW